MASKRLWLGLLGVLAGYATAQDEVVEPSPDGDNTQQSAEASPRGQPQARRSGVISLGTTVTGNQEQPEVLYIVPWQPARDDTILYQPINSRTDSVFRHLERDEHRRHLDFLQELEKGPRVE